MNSDCTSIHSRKVRKFKFLMWKYHQDRESVQVPTNMLSHKSEIILLVNYPCNVQKHIPKYLYTNTGRLNIASYKCGKVSERCNISSAEDEILRKWRTQVSVSHISIRTGQPQGPTTLAQDP